MLQSAVRTKRRMAILDFDIENRPLSYKGRDWTTSEVTAIAASFGPDEPMHCWLLGVNDPVDMLREFRALYDRAEVVTGHYIRKHDLPLVNGAMIEYGLPPLGGKLTCDTYFDLAKLSGVGKSQENLAVMLGVDAPKVGMSEAAWRSANRLQLDGIVSTRRRVTGDVIQHMQLRKALLDLGWLTEPRRWEPRRAAK